MEERGSATRSRWGEATDEPASARQSEVAAAREDARPTNGQITCGSQSRLTSAATFTTSDVYAFTRELEKLYPDNSDSHREQAGMSATLEPFGKRRKEFDRR